MNDSGKIELPEYFLQTTTSTVSWIFTRILPNNRDDVLPQDWSDSPCCYICNEWRPITFTYIPSVSGPNGHNVTLCIWPSSEYPFVRNVDMPLEEVSYKLFYSVNLYVPRTQVLYSFIVDGIPVVANDQPTVANTAKASLQ